MKGDTRSSDCSSNNWLRAPDRPPTCRLLWPSDSHRVQIAVVGATKLQNP